MKFPKPETIRAYLISSGIERPTPTVHHYYKTEAVVLPGPGGAAWKHWFQCFKTGALRVWGTEERLTVVPEVDGELTELKSEPDPEMN